MGNGNKSGLEGCCGSQKSSSFECDVGLGLKMQHTESYPCKKMMVMSHPPYHHQHQRPSSETSFGSDCGGSSNGSSIGGPFYCINTNNGVSSLYNPAVGAASRTFHSFSTDNTSFNFKSSGGGMAASGKALFTASQLQELERQTMIYKYMMASIRVPPELLIPNTKSSSHVPVSQSNISALDSRFSGGSYPEPWRCRRTDGKKWRCSRDVAPDQKYCERHAHKSRPRSRKHVETQSHTTTTTTTNISSSTNNYTHNHPLILPSCNTTEPFQKPISQFPTSYEYDQPRCVEWFLKGGSIPVSTSNQQWPQLMQSSSKLELKRDNIDHSKSASFFQQHYEEEHEPMNLNPYMDGCGDQRLENQQLNDCSLLHPKLPCLQGSLNAGTTHTTRHFIDAWSTAEREDLNEMRNKCSVSSSGKLPVSSLTLSMSGGNEFDEGNEHAQMGLGMMDSERGTGGVSKSHWLNPVSWMGSPPGGPLGEALCLGIASTAKVASNVPSPHGYSNSTTTSSCSKSSCEDGGNGLDFIR